MQGFVRSWSLRASTHPCHRTRSLQLGFRAARHVPGHYALVGPRQSDTATAYLMGRLSSYQDHVTYLLIALVLLRSRLPLALGQERRGGFQNRPLVG